MNTKSKFLLCTLIASSIASFSYAQDSQAPKDILEAVEQGSLDWVKKFVVGGAGVNATYDSGLTILMYAASAGNLEVVEFLVNSGAIVDLQSKKMGPWLNYYLDYSCTALVYAVEKGHLDIVEFLVSRGADVNLEMAQGNTVLEHATFSFNIDVFAFLESKGAKWSPTIVEINDCFIWSADSGKLKAVKFFLGYGADLNAQLETVKYTALMMAANRANFDVVKFLVEQGADLNMKSYGGKTALDIAKTDEIKVYLKKAMSHS